jgi:hypothetical protein
MNSWLAVAAIIKSMSVAHDIKWLVCLLMQSMDVWKVTGINIEGASKDVVVRWRDLDVL